MSVTNETIESWIRVQSLWIYLEAVFVGGDIAKQLPAETRSFQNIDRHWVKLMERAHDSPNVVTFCNMDSSLQELLARLEGQLEACQRTLSGYLEHKRNLFPRFFFVSDSVLLEMLGHASNPAMIQKHLLSVFDNTKSVKFSEHKGLSKAIIEVYSSENEEVKASAMTCFSVAVVTVLPITCFTVNIVRRFQGGLTMFTCVS